MVNVCADAAIAVGIRSAQTKEANFRSRGTLRAAEFFRAIRFMVRLFLGLIVSRWNSTL
jgi:hypothetical protein